MSQMRIPSLLMTLCWLLAALPAQEDLRDAVTLRNGRVVKGRVIDPHAAVELVVRQGGKRIRIERSDVAEIHLVRNDIDRFFAMETRMQDQPKAQWMLVEWAASRQLHGLARVLAMREALDHDDDRAHEHLGHRRRKDVWLWPHGGRWLPKDDLLKQVVERGATITGERFEMTTDGDLRFALDALIDVERMAAWWYAEYSEGLGLSECLQPIRIRVSGGADSFAKWGLRAVPYYVPAPHGDEARTFHAGPASRRPQLLFFVASHALLYHTMIGEVSPTDSRDRVCPWLELGLAMLAEQTFQGEPGKAKAGSPQNQDLQALQALARNYRLTHLLHLPMYGGFYLADDTATAINWSAAASLVQFLLDDRNQPATRARFLGYARSALLDRKGDSSSLFDDAMGETVESLEPSFRAWMQKTAGL
jgi:hypothetical protein